MMTNLFSIFDPSGFMQINGWIILLFILGFLPKNKFVSSSALLTLPSSITQSLKLELDTPLAPGVYSNMSKGLLAVFMFIVMMNTMGLVPYVFTPTAHIITPLMMALPMWLAIFWFGWMMKPEQSFAHLVPVGTPNLLMPFMVIIETISSVIRPITLSIRLMANMVAGHLLLSLAGGGINGLASFISLFSAQLILIILEMAVALIQGYVFMILMTLYIKEVYFNTLSLVLA